MSTRSLEEDLREIPGVEGAEMDSSGGSPGGLRIRIAEGVDQGAVGQAIRQVLTKHGFGTDTCLPGEAPIPEVRSDETQADEVTMEPLPVEPEAETAAEEQPSSIAVIVDDEPESLPTVVDLTDEDAGPGEDPEGGGRPDAEVVAPPSPLLEDVGDTVEASTSPGSWGSAGSDDPVGGQSEEKLTPATVTRLERVAVEEARSGISVIVSTTDGRSATEAASSTEGGVEEAVVKAASQLARPGQPDPNIVEIEDRRIEGVDIVMIVLDLDGNLAVGAAIVVAGRSFALGRATWAALSM